MSLLTQPIKTVSNCFSMLFFFFLMLDKVLCIASHSLLKCFLYIIVSHIFYYIFPEEKVKVLSFAVEKKKKKKGLMLLRVCFLFHVIFLSF